MRMSPSYLPTITLTPVLVSAITSGTLPVRPGQWMALPLTNRKGRFVRSDGGTLVISWTGVDTVQGHNRRFSKACITHNKQEPTKAEPKGTPFGVLKSWLNRANGWRAA